MTSPELAPGEVEELRQRLREAEETLEAVRQGAVDSLVIGPAESQQIYTLATADQPYRLIVAGMGEGAATISESGTIVFANSRLAELVRKPSSELVGSPVLTLAANRDAFAALLDVTAGDSNRAQLELLRADGTAAPVLASVSGVELSPTTFVRCLILTDLTALRQAERELAWSQAAVRKRDVLLEEAAYVVGLGTWESAAAVDAPAIWSGNVYTITGCSRDELEPEQQSVFRLTHPEDQAAFRTVFTSALAGGAPFRVRHRIVRPDGEIRWVRQAAVVQRERGAPTRVLGVIQDITDQVAAAEQARHQAAQLEQRVAQRTAELTNANRDLEAFTYSISHDLRAPLRAITMFSRTLLEENRGELGEDSRYYAERVLANAEHMSSLLEALLQLTRVAQAPMRVRSVDLSGLARGALADLAAREPHRRVEVTVQEGVRALADPTLIRTVLQNLLENAWRYTSRRERAQIEFGTTPTTGEAIGCYVRDNGAGFDPAYADRLFQPFHRLHAEQEYSGTGMGLASVRQIVRRHGGRVWAEGQEGTGATFFFTLDTARVAPTAAADTGESALSVAAVKAAIERRLEEVAPPDEAGAAALRRELLAAFRARVPPGLTRLAEAVADGGAQDLRREAHHLQGPAETIGATALARRCGELAEQAGTGEVEDPAAALRAILQAYDLTQQALTQVEPDSEESPDAE